MENTTTIASTGMGKSLDRSWSSTKANIFLLAGFTLFYFIVSMMLMFIPGINTLANFFSFVLTAGIFSAYDTYEKTRKLEFNDFFSWSPRFGRLFLGNLLIFGIALLLFIPIIIGIIVFLGAGAFTVLFNNPEDFIGLFGTSLLVFALIIMLLGLLLGIWLFAYPFIIQFTDMPLSDALRLSWKIGRNNIGHLIVFVLLAIGLSILGFICLGIGVTVTTPLILGTQYFFLRSLFATEDSDKWDFIKQQETV